MRRRKWTSNGQFCHQNDSGYDNSFPTRHFPFKIENWNILEQTTMATHLGGIGVGGLRRRVDLHGLVDAQGLDLRGEHSQKILSLLFSLSNCRSCGSARLQAWNSLDEKDYVNEKKRQKQIGLEYSEQKKTVGIIPVTTSSGLRSCESAPCHS